MDKKRNVKNYIFSLNPHLRVFNELQHDGLSCILKFEIDDKKSKLTDSQLDELLHELIQNVKYATCSNDDLEYIILTSCNNKQNSFHLLFPTLYISSASHQQIVIFTYFKDIITKFNSLYQFDIIDKGIYGKTLFRMPYCTKHKQNRPFIPLSNSQYYTFQKALCCRNVITDDMVCIDIIDNIEYTYYDDTTEYDNSEYFHDNCPLFSKKIKMEISSSSGIEWYNFMVLLHNSGIPYSFFDTINKYDMSKYNETKNNQRWHSLSKSRITLQNNIQFRQWLLRYNRKNNILL